MKEEVTRKDKDKDEETKMDEDEDEEDTDERKKAKTKQRGRQLVKERRVKVTIITIATNWHNNKCKTLTPKVCSSGGKAKEYKLPSIHRYVVL